MQNISSESDMNILIVPFGYAVFVFGLTAFALGAVVPLGVALPVAGVLSLAWALLKWHAIATGIMARWSIGNRAVIAERAATAANHEFMAQAFAAPGRPSPKMMVPAEDEAEVRADGITIHDARGTRKVARLNAAELAEHQEAGECLRWLAIGQRAGKFSHRAMREHRPPTMSAEQFQEWWQRRGDQLVAWNLFEKVERSGTRPLMDVADVRAALLTHSWPGRGPAEAVSTHLQTDRLQTE